jgi:hypothetical protein
MTSTYSDAKERHLIWVWTKPHEREVFEDGTQEELKSDSGDRASLDMAGRYRPEIASTIHQYPPLSVADEGDDWHLDLTHLGVEAESSLPYKFVKELSMGGSANVVMVKHTRTGRQYAKKSFKISSRSTMQRVKGNSSTRLEFCGDWPCITISSGCTALSSCKGS